MGTKKKKSKWWWPLLVIAIVLFIIYHLATLGKGKVPNVRVIPDAFKDSKTKSIHKHKRLSVHVAKQEQLKKKLDLIFKWTYFGVRLGLVATWVTIMLIFWKINHIANLEDFLNYSEASILVIITFNFLTFGRLSNLNEFLKRIKIRTENWIYGKYINIDGKIEAGKLELGVGDSDVSLVV